jgi:hypothetical protein
MCNEAVDWIHLAQNLNQWRALDEHSNKSSYSIKCWKCLEWLSNLRRPQLSEVICLAREDIRTEDGNSNIRRYI